MKRYLLCIAILISIVFFSCKKETTPDIGTNHSGLLTKVLILGEPFHEYTYTSSGLIREEKSWATYTKHTYNSSNLLEKSESWIDPSIYSSSTYVIAEARKRKEWANPKNTSHDVTNTYTYTNTGQLLERNVARANGTQCIVKYELNEKGLISKDIVYDEGKQSGYVDYTYDVQGNLISEKHYRTSAEGKSELSHKTEYEFDNQKNPYFPFNKLLYPGRATNQNNIIKATYTAYGNTPSVIEWENITKHEYEYNDLGYPVKIDGETVYEYE